MVSVEKFAAGAGHVVEIMERLAHSHEDEIGDRKLIREAGDLAEDLVLREIAGEVLAGREAKAAAHGAAGLARHTEGHAIGVQSGASRRVVNHHGFDPVAVVEIPQHFDRSIIGTMPGTFFEKGLRGHHGLFIGLPRNGVKGRSCS